MSERKWGEGEDNEQYWRNRMAETKAADARRAEYESRPEVITLRAYDAEHGIKAQSGRIHMGGRMYRFEVGVVEIFGGCDEWIVSTDAAVNAIIMQRADFASRCN